MIPGAAPDTLASLLPSDRRFGLFWSGVGAAGAVVFAGFGQGVASTLCAAAAALSFALALWQPQRLHRLNRAWLQLGLLLSRVVNPLVMGVLYFGLLVPVGLAQRLLGRDELRLRRPASGASLWVPRPADPRGARAFQDQY